MSHCSVRVITQLSAIPGTSAFPALAEVPGAKNPFFA